VINRRLYLSQFLIVLGGNGAAQLLNLLGYPLIARLYSPHEFGVFGLFIATVAILGAVASGRLEYAIPTAHRPGALAVLWVALTFSGVAGLVAIVGSAFYWRSAMLPVLLGLCITLTGMATALSALLMRQERFRVVSMSVTLRTAIVVAAQAGLGFISATGTSLIFGFALGLAAQAAMLLLAARPKRPNWPRMRAMARHYRTQMRVDVPTGIIGALSLNIMPFLLALLFDQRTVGFYTLGNRLAIIPFALFTDSLAQVFFQKAARARERVGHIWHEFKFNLLAAGAVSFGLLVALLFLARPVIGAFLGERWLPAADMLIVLAPMLAIRGVALSMSATVFVLRSAHWLFIYSVGNLLLPVVAFAAAMFWHLRPLTFLSIVSALLAIEALAFAVLLTFAAKRTRIVSRAAQTADFQ
jgi:lipopolysaccharide exporter